MNTDDTTRPDEDFAPWAPTWPSTDASLPRQDALPLPEPADGDAILYPSDPTTYPGFFESGPEPASDLAPPASPPVVPHEPDTPVGTSLLPSTPAPAPAGSGVGRGLLLGLLLGAVIAAAGFGLGRLTAGDDSNTAGPQPGLVATVPPTTAGATTATSLVGSTEPPPAAVVPQASGDLEPVAAAAATITPAVVRLDTGTGTGSGVIYDADGYILTAAHVVGSAGSVSITFADGSRTTGTVLGADEATDVAVVEIDAGEVPAVAELAIGAQLTVGQTAVAVGSPFRLDQTVTSGIISAVDRIVNRVSMVQTDAAINPGNSGGPLVDLQGRVLGINDVIFTNSNDNAGVGFAISIDLAKIVADQITAGEEVSLALLGVSVGASPDGDAGGLIQEVGEGTAAAAAGIEVGDLVVALDGDPIRDSEELRAEVITRAPGTVIALELIRDGERLLLEIELGSISTN